MSAFLTVYNASAGSGKTFTLTVDYLSLLLTADLPNTYRYILAVTFTNKATTEMKRRILQQLYGICHNLPESNAYLQQIKDKTGYNEQTLRIKARNCLLHIIHHYDYFRVNTIDSFFQTILSSLTHELHLAANIQVEINDKEIIEQSVEQILQELTPNSPILHWIYSYIQDKIKENQRWDISKEIKTFAMNLVLEKYLINEHKLKHFLSDNCKISTYKKEITEAKEWSKDIIQSASIQFLEKLSDYQITEKTFSNGKYLFAYLHNLSQGLFKEPNATLCKYMQESKYWLRKSDLKNFQLIQLIENEFLPILNEVELIRKKYTIEYNSCILTLQHLNPLRLLNVINDKVNTLNQEMNRFLLAKTPILLHRLIGDDDASFVMEKTGSQIRHIMIDEFQDTSLLQWKNFKNLIFNNLSSGETSLLVGDVKQSIYRWRNGDWSILYNIQKEFPHSDINIHLLETNYRSELNIIEFNNHFFTNAAKLLTNLNDESEYSIQNLYNSVEQKCPLAKKQNSAGFVYVNLRTEKKDEETGLTWKEKILYDMASQIIILNGNLCIPYSQMAILVRNNTHATYIVDFFSENYPHIPLISNEAFLLSSSMSVQLIIHTLRYLLNREDPIAAVYIAEHYQLYILKKTIDPILIYTNPLSFLPQKLIEDSEDLSSMPLFIAIENIIQIMSLLQQKEDLAYLQTFIDETLLFLDDNSSDIADFIRYWEDTLQKKSIPVSDNLKGIRILTIHKSKGLQFHTLFMPFANWELESDRPSDLLWCEPNRAPYNKLPLIPISTNSITAQSIYIDDYNREHLQRRIENLNLLYVGFTRAEKNLFIWGTGKKESLPNKTATTGDLIAAVLQDDLVINDEGNALYTRGNYTYYDESPKDIKNCTNRLSLPCDLMPLDVCPGFQHISFLQSNESQGFLYTEEKTEELSNDYIIQGNILHKLFSKIATLDDIAPVLVSFEREGLFENHSSLLPKIRTIIYHCLKSPIIADWFSPKWTLFTECNIVTVNEYGQTITRRPDRIMINNDKVVVVDFKFGKPQKKHREQVTEYISLLQNMGYTNPQGFLWYVFTNQIVPIN